MAGDLEIRAALANVSLAEFPEGITSKRAYELKEGEKGVYDLHFNYPLASQHWIIKEQLAKLPVKVNLHQRVRRHQVQSGIKGLPNIRNVIAIGSGKGGVGKSTIAVGLAQALLAEGAKVGLLDADIYGPSIPTMLGIFDKPTSPDGKSMDPIDVAGLKTISIGYLTEPDTPMIWRGPIVTNTLKQLLFETNWGELDFLVVDLPPGTGDTQLTLAQNIPVSASIVVTTPQNVAVADAQKAIRMFERVNIHVLGIVENMSAYCCPNCGHSLAIFSEGGGEYLASKYDNELLGKIPLDPRICKALDEGLSLHQQVTDQFEKFQILARRIASKLASRPIDFTAKMPSVEVTNLT